ncbi:pilus assembly FimT family protein [Desulfobulbus propionicus]|jgi:general secretion pathway protein H
MASFRTGHAGFTLLELIVVMALIGLTAGFAMPQLGGFLAADQMKSDVRKLIGLIHQTANLARREQEPYLLTYRPDEHRFVAEPEEKRDQESTEQSGKLLSLPVAESVVVGEFWSWYGGVQDRDERRIRFSREGYIEPTILYLGREDGREMSLILSPFLGTIRVEENHVVPDATIFAH